MNELKPIFLLYLLFINQYLIASNIETKDLAFGFNDNCHQQILFIFFSKVTIALNISIM